MKNHETPFLKEIEKLFKEFETKIKDDELLKIIKRQFVISIPNMDAKVLFIGMNPSFRSKQDNNHSNFDFWGEKQRSDMYFKKLHSIIPPKYESQVTYLDMLMQRHSNQADLARFLDSKTGLEFIGLQLKITQQIIEEMKPQLICVFNSFASNFWGLNTRPSAENPESNIWMGYSFKKADSNNLYTITGLLNGRINEGLKKTNLENTKVYFSKYLGRFVGKEEVAGIEGNVSKLIIKTLV